MKDLNSILLVYFGVISIITVSITSLDKFFAKRDMRRISEKALLILAFLGGSPAEYLTMKLIRHKTLHRKFMVGLPVMMLLQVVGILAMIYLNN